MLTKDQAVALLNRAEVVAIPTETVYGLAARIDKEEGINNIFRIKERPSFDPLIVHVHSSEQAREYAGEWSEIHETLTKKFWPGPLTLVLPKTDKISSVISAGLDSVGLRCPNHPLALSLLKKIKAPLAAPSANKFSKTSPTTAEHVRESLPDVAVLDGGPCEVGIESTIIAVNLAEKAKIQLLRPGMILWQDVKVALKAFDVEFVENSASTVAPGSLKDHYMPEIPLVLVNKDVSNDNLIAIVQKNLKQDFNSFEELVFSEESYLAARELYAKLHSLNHCRKDFAIIRIKNSMKTESWQPLLDRLKKAASYTL